MGDKFKVTPKSDIKEDKSVTMSIRMPRELQEEYDDIAYKSNRSRNEVVVMALEYAIQNLELTEKK